MVSGEMNVQRGPQISGMPDASMPLTGRSSQSTLDPSPRYNEGTRFQMKATWGQKLLTVVKKIGFGLGCVVCGAISLAMPQFLIIGGILIFSGAYHAKKTAGHSTLSQIEMRAGWVLVSPLFGFSHCLKELTGTK